MSVVLQQDQVSRLAVRKEGGEYLITEPGHMFEGEKEEAAELLNQLQEPRNGCLLAARGQKKVLEPQQGWKVIEKAAEVERNELGALARYASATPANLMTRALDTAFWMELSAAGLTFAATASRALWGGDGGDASSEKARRHVEMRGSHQNRAHT